VFGSNKPKVPNRIATTSAQYRNIGKPNNLKVFGSNKIKSPNRKAKIGQGHLRQRRRNLVL
jgi:hypothetical protein